MFDDDFLRSKYTRLGVEFKKLREKHRIAKENLKSISEQARLLETRLTDQSIHVRNLEQEKESLIFRNQYLVKQASFLQTQLDSRHRQNSTHSSHINNDQQTSSNEALQRALAECSRLHEELVSQSSNFLSKIVAMEDKCRLSQNVRLLQSVAIQTNLNPIGFSSSFDALSLQEPSKEKDANLLLTGSISLASTSSPQESTSDLLSSSPSLIPLTTLRRSSKTKSDQVHLLKSPWHTRSASLPGINPHTAPKDEQLGTREQLLLLRIGQLERQVAEASLKQHIEFRRNQLAQYVSSCSSALKETDKSQNPEERQSLFENTLTASKANLLPSPLNSSSLSQSSSTSLSKSIQIHDKLLSDFLENQLAECNRQLVVYAGRAAAASDEVRSLYELLNSACRERDYLQEISQSFTLQTANLEEELETTKMRAAQQLSEMAGHLASLTDEIHFLRDGQPASVTTNGKHPSTDSVRLSKPSTNYSAGSVGGGTAHDKVNSFLNSLLR